MEIGLKPIILEIELFLFTMLNMKMFLNQLIDLVLIILIPIMLTSITKSIKNGLPLKDIGFISTSVIVMLKMQLLVSCIMKELIHKLKKSI